MAAGATLVLALHALLALLLPLPRPEPPPALPAQPPLVWLLPPAEPAPAAPPAATRTVPARPAPERRQTAATPLTQAREAQPITLPAPADAAAGAPSPPSTIAPSRAPPPLDLTLPLGASAPWRTRHPALDDPRLARGQRTLEATIAAALGGDERIVEERLDANRVRLRSGRGCVLLTRTRTSQLDPGGPWRDTWLVGGC